MKTPRVISSENVYKSKYVEINNDTLEFNGKMWNHVYFSRPSKDGASIIPIDDDGIYLVEQYRHPHKKFFWQTPMGMINPGDSPRITAQKELKEETGITAKDFFAIGSFIPEPGMSDQEVFVYVAEGLSFGDSQFEKQEIGMNVRCFGYEEIKEEIRKGTITCGFTLSALTLFWNNYKINLK